MATIAQLQVGSTKYWLKGVRLDTMRQTTANLTSDGSGLMTHFIASTSMTEAKPSTGDGHIIQMNWDNTTGYDTQLYIRNTNIPQMRMRGQSNNVWGDWVKVYSENDKPSLTADITGTLPIANGGTGQTTAGNAINYLLQNGCSVGSSTPSDNDTYIASYADGKNKDGNGVNTFHRRPLSALWAYIKGKTDSLYATTSHTHSYLPLAGGTMTGQLKTSFKSSVAVGSYCPSAATIENLCEELRFSSGACGSVSITTAYTKNNITIPTGWYNFIWVPHRSGGVNGAASGDNANYGTLYLTGMTTTNGYRLRYFNNNIADLRNLDNFSFGTAAPSGGNSGDIYIQYS